MDSYSYVQSLVQMMNDNDFTQQYNSCPVKPPITPPIVVEPPKQDNLTGSDTQTLFKLINLLTKSVIEMDETEFLKFKFNSINFRILVDKK